MSAYINSFLIEPVVRQARRFSQPLEDRPLATQQHNSVASPLSQAHFPAHVPTIPASEEALSDAPEDSTTHNPLHQHAHDSERSLPLASAALHATLPATISITSELPQPLQGHNLDNGPNLFLDRGPVRSPSPAEDMELADDMDRREATTLDSLRVMSLDHAPSMSSNPSIRRFTSHDGTMQPRHGTETSRADTLNSRPRSREGSPHSTMSDRIPENDGMKTLREQLHQIRDMALSSEEKASRMHKLMNADYRAFKASRLRRASSEYTQEHALKMEKISSLTSDQDVTSNHPARETFGGSRDRQYELFNVSQKDLRPSYSPPSPATEGQTRGRHDRSHDNAVEDDPLLGCAHYKRNVKVQCPDCRRWYPCRHCHDEVQDHTLVRKNIQNMLCMLCGSPQAAAEYCTSCEEQTAFYYCDICKLWDNDTNHRIYHCPDCGICRKGEGLGKDYAHCKKCNVCISIKWATAHRCVERATECDCPICGEYMFTSSTSVVAMKCGHYIHRSCYDSFMQTAYKCPICSRSAVNMEIQWRKLDRAIEAQPMPEQWQRAQASVNCNDCLGKCWTSYHWLGSKCRLCDSYNTQLNKIIHGPDDNHNGASNENGPDQLENLAESTPQTNNLSAGTAPFQHPILADHAHSPLLDAIAASADIDSASITEGNFIMVNAGEQGMPHSPILQDIQAPRSPANTSITAVGSPHYPGRLSNSPEVQMLDVQEESESIRVGHEEEDVTSFWGEPISPSGFLSRMSSPVNWGSPSFFGSNASPRRREAEDDDIDDAEIIEDDGEGVFGWGLSPSAWAISPPAFFTYRFGARSSEEVNDEAHGHDGDGEGASDGEESGDDSDSDGSGAEGEAEAEEDVEMDELLLPGHR